MLCIERLWDGIACMYVLEQCPSNWQWLLLVPMLCIYPLIGMSGARCLPSPPRIPPLRRCVVFVVRSVPDRVPLIVSDIPRLPLCVCGSLSG